MSESVLCKRPLSSVSSVLPAELAASVDSVSADSVSAELGSALPAELEQLILGYAEIERVVLPVTFYVDDRTKYPDVYPADARFVLPKAKKAIYWSHVLEYLRSALKDRKKWNEQRGFGVKHVCIELRFESDPACRDLGLYRELHLSCWSNPASSFLMLCGFLDSLELRLEMKDLSLDVMFPSGARFRGQLDHLVVSGAEISLHAYESVAERLAREAECEIIEC